MSHTPQIKMFILLPQEDWLKQEQYDRFSNSYLASSYYQSFIYSPTDAQVLKTVLKYTLKFTLKQLQHVSVLQLHHHQGAH